MTVNEKEIVKDLLDLASIDVVAASDKGTEIELVHPTTRIGLGQYVSIVGQHSLLFRNKADQQSDADRRKAFAAQRRGRTPDVKTTEQSRLESLDLIATCIIGFRNIRFEGVLLTFSYDNAFMLIYKSPWIRQQIDAAIVDDELFI